MNLTESISFSNFHVVIVNAFGHNNHVVEVWFYDSPITVQHKVDNLMIININY